mgnify:CR=1 FL=1
MTKYLQTNEKGYVVNITNEPVLVGLYGGNPKNYRKISDKEGKEISKLIKMCHARGEGLHVDDIAFEETKNKAER